MSIAEEVAVGVGKGGGPLLDNGISRINKETVPALKDALRELLDGAVLDIGGLPVTIKLKPKQ